MNQESDAIHASSHIDNQYQSVSTPLYMTSTFETDLNGQNPEGVFYSRYVNPTRKGLEETIAKLEHGTYCAATASGMAALTLILFLLKSGDHIIAHSNLYGGTDNMFRNICPQWNIDVTFIDDMNDSQALKDNIKDNTALIWFETPSNPLLELTDIKTLVKTIKTINPDILIGVDNTFMTPVFQNPLELGADLVLHSTTKYINGHSDIIGGAVVCKDTALSERLDYYNKFLGTNASVFDSWATLRGVKTLPCRMQAHQTNAQAIAEFLEGHNSVKKVLYPGLKSHPQYNLAKEQMNGFGGMLSFYLDTDKVNVEKFFESVKLIILAVSLGGIESLISFPWTMSHGCVPDEAKLACGIDQSLIRLSVGIENVDDLTADLKQALESAEIV